MPFNYTYAKAADEHDRKMLHELAAKLNRKQQQLIQRGWKGEAVYQWLCLMAGRWLNRYAPKRPVDPHWTVRGWSIGRAFRGPSVSFDISQDRITVDGGDGHLAWERHNEL